MSMDVGSVVEGKITSITKFGAFVALEDGKSGMVHVSEISDEFVSDISRYVSVGQTVRVGILNVDEKGRINLSIKKASENREKPSRPVSRCPSVPRPQVAVYASAANAAHSDRPLSFEEMMSKFKKDSDERFSDLGESKEFRKANYAKRSHK